MLAVIYYGERKMEMPREAHGVEEKSTTDNNRFLLTPIGLQQYLLAQFDFYCNDKKPEALKANKEAPALGSSTELLEEFKKDKKATASKFFGAAGAFFKKTASLAYDHAKRTHASTTEFVANEMEHILRQPCSALKKMTDLTILFHGLYNYMATRNSKELKPLLEEVMRSLWAGTPQIIPLYRGNLIVGSTSVDKQTFVTRFEKQIQVAQKLIMSNSTAVDRAFNEKRMRALNEEAMSEGVPPKLAGDNNNPQEWQYRCSELAELGHHYTAYGAYQPPTAWMGDVYKVFLNALTVDHYTLSGEAAVLMPMHKRRESDVAPPQVIPDVLVRDGNVNDRPLSNSPYILHPCSPMLMGGMLADQPPLSAQSRQENGLQNSNNPYQGAPVVSGSHGAPLYPSSYSPPPPPYRSASSLSSGNGANIYGMAPSYASSAPAVYGYPSAQSQGNNAQGVPAYVAPVYQPNSPWVNPAAPVFLAPLSQLAGQVGSNNQPVRAETADPQHFVTSNESQGMASLKK
jgi:hypothetical protein